MERKKWTPEEDVQLLNLSTQRSQNSQSLKQVFIVVAQNTGHSENSVASRYYKKIASNSQPSETAVETRQERRAPKPWTKEEDDRLVRQICAFPQNLHHCFILVSEEIGRTPTACAAHWYSVLSKREDVLIFITATNGQIARNRKNSGYMPCSNSIWRRICNMMRQLFRK